MKFLAAIIITAAFMTTSVNAHCGACSTSKTHDHASQKTAANNMHTILNTAEKAGSFKTLLTALEAAGLNEALSAEGPFTVFAPTDEAFAALPEGTVENLLKDKEKLKAVLTYHVLDGAVKAENVLKVDKALTLNGQSVSVKVNDKIVMVDNAQVVKTDILCSNGVIHVIDAVILPDFDKMK